LWRIFVDDHKFFQVDLWTIVEIKLGFKDENQKKDESKVASIKTLFDKAQENLA